MPKEIVVEKKYEGISPKNFLRKYVDLPYFKIIKLIKEKRITLNGKKIKDEMKLTTGDVIKLWKDDIPLVGNNKNDSNKVSKDLNITTIFENDDFMVLNKPSGVVVQGAQHTDLSLSYHLEFLRRKNKDSEDYFHVHRLDKDTTGVLIVSKNTVALRELNKVFKERDIVKVYECLCVGRFENFSGDVEVFMKRTEEGSKEKCVVCDGGVDSKKTLSSYKVIEEYEYKDDIFSLVEVELKTGFMHQIRVHMKYLGCPIVGDKMYGNSSVNRKFEGVLDRQFLHAKRVSFEYKGEKFSFTAPFPKDLKKTLSLMKKV